MAEDAVVDNPVVGNPEAGIRVAVGNQEAVAVEAGSLGNADNAVRIVVSAVG